MEQLLEQFSEYKKSTGLHPDTVALYATYVLQWLEYLSGNGVQSLFSADKEIVQGYYNHCIDKGYSSATVYKKAKAVYELYEWLQLTGRIILNPCPLPPPCKQTNVPKNVPTVKAVQHTFRMLSDSKSIVEQRDQIIIDLAYCGLRRIELHNLNVQDIRDDRTVRVHTKRDAIQNVVIGEKTYQALMHYIYHVRPRLLKTSSTDALFISWKGGGKRLHKYSINAIFRRLRKKYSLADSIKPHNMRRAYATHTLSAGAPLLEVSKLLRHTKIQTTTIYTRVDPKELKTLHTQFSPRP